jgi:hypothetical protein
MSTCRRRCGGGEKEQERRKEGARRCHLFGRL